MSNQNEQTEVEKTVRELIRDAVEKAIEVRKEILQKTGPGRDALAWAEKTLEFADIVDEESIQFAITLLVQEMSGELSTTGRWDRLKATELILEYAAKHPEPPPRLNLSSERSNRVSRKPDNRPGPRSGPKKTRRRWRGSKPCG